MAQRWGAARHRALASERRMDAAEAATAKESVLLDTEKLTQAVKSSTKGGKKKLVGLYLPSGAKIEQSAEHKRAQTAEVVNDEAQRDLALSRVAKHYQTRQHRRRRSAERSKKSEEEYDDEESARKARAILAKSSDHERMQYEELFNFFDVDKDQTWGSIEFAQRMTDIGCATTVEAASNLLYFAGVRDVDRITYDDFVQLMPKLKAFRILLEKDAMRAFQAKDARGQGWISCKALREVLAQISGPGGVDEDQVDQILRKADRERTGMVTFDFFCRALFGTPPLLQYKPPSRGMFVLNQLCFCGKSSGGAKDDSDSDEETRR